MLLNIIEGCSTLTAVYAYHSTAQHYLAPPRESAVRRHVYLASILYRLSELLPSIHDGRRCQKLRRPAPAAAKNSGYWCRIVMRQMARYRAMAQAVVSSAFQQGSTGGE